MGISINFGGMVYINILHELLINFRWVFSNGWKKKIYIYINPFREMGLMIFPSSLPEMHQEFKRCLASPKNVTRAGKTSETETRNLNEITHPIQNLAGKSTKHIGEKYIYS